MNKLSWILCLSLAACAYPKSPANQVTADTQQRLLPFDPDVRTGTLKNGLTYYVEQNSVPKARAELRLVVRAGSINENEDQRGLAHVVEHMAFNGTKSFSGTELVRSLESLGIRFGAHLNAYTSFDETVYMLQIPTDDMATLERGLTILSEWAGHVAFDPEELERERGVVIEEWRRSRGARSRLRNKLLPLTHHGSLYKDRQPIGTKDALQNFTREQVVEFYRTWYRPNLMAVIAVGDFEPDLITEKIRRTFKNLRNPEHATPRTYADLPSDHEPLIGVFTDPELPQTSFSIMSKVHDTQQPTYGYYRQNLVEQIAFFALNERLAERSRDPNANLLGARAGAERMTPRVKSQNVSAAVEEDKLEPGLIAVWNEIRRLRTFGLLPSEFARARKKLSVLFDTYYNEREKTDSRVHAAELVRVFTTAEAAPGIENEVHIAHDLLANITIDEVNTFTSKWFSKSGRVLSVILPKKSEAKHPTKAELFEVIARAENMQIHAKGDASPPRPLIDQTPPPGTVTARRTHDNIGLHDWRLSNGMRVLLKPTPFKNDEILLRAFSFGGTITSADEVFPSARAANTISQLSGLGGFNVVELNKALAGKRVSLNSSIGEYAEVLNGRSSVADLETLLQLAHLKFTSPRLTPAGLELFIRQTSESIRNRARSPNTLFQDEYRKLMWQGYARYAPWNAVTLSAVDLDSARAFLENRFRNAADFTVLLVGNFEPEKIEALLTRYLASLPGDPTSLERPLEQGAVRTSKQRRALVRRGLEQKAQVHYTLHGPFRGNPAERFLLSAMVDLLSTRLRERLREHLGGTYSVSVSPRIRRYPQPSFAVSIAFGCAPDRVDELLEQMKTIIEGVRNTTASQDELQTLQQQRLRAWQTALEQNSFWLNQLSSAIENQEALDAFTTYESRVEKLTSEQLQAAARRYLVDDRAVEVILLPESAKSPYPRTTPTDPPGL